MKTIFLRLSVLLLVVLAFDSPSTAQSNSAARSDSADASISGVLEDTSGGALADVAITATVEGQTGACRFDNFKCGWELLAGVICGRYRVRFVRSPFMSVEHVVEVRSGESVALNSRLTLERLSSEVVVTAQAEPMLLEQTTTGVSVISREEIDARQSVGVADALLFSPGVAIGRTGAEGGTASIFLNGGNSNFTKVLVDGAPINPPGGAVDFSTGRLGRSRHGLIRSSEAIPLLRNIHGRTSNHGCFV